MSKRRRARAISAGSATKAKLPERTITPPIAPGQKYLLGLLHEKVEPNGDRHFCGTIAGMKYLLMPAKSNESAATGERKWNLYVQPVARPRTKSASERTRRAR